MKINRLKKAGYGSGSAGDVIVINLIIVYGLYYLTDVVGMNALHASYIIFAATIMCTVSIGLIGYISDHYPIACRKRVPYMLISILPTVVPLVIFFGMDPFFSAGKTWLYFVILLVILVAHSCYMVPYEALGADVSQDNDVRTDLRSYARWFMSAGNLAGVVAILPIVGKLGEAGLSETGSWRIAAGFSALLSLGAFLFTCATFLDFREPPPRASGAEPAATDGTRTGATETDAASWVSGILGDYLGVLRNRPFRIVLYITLFMSSTNIFFTSCIVYYMKYNVGINEDAKAFALFLMSATGLVLVPAIAKACERFGGGRVMMILFLMTGIFFIIFGFTGIRSMEGLCFLITTFSLGSSAYWQLIYVLLYETCDIDEIKEGRKREGVAVSTFRMVLKGANAASTQLLGFVLSLFGYSPMASVQSEHTLRGIESCVTFMPGIASIAAGICVMVYIHLQFTAPIDKSSSVV